MHETEGLRTKVILKLLSVSSTVRSVRCWKTAMSSSSKTFESTGCPWNSLGQAKQRHQRERNSSRYTREPEAGHFRRNLVSAAEVRALLFRRLPLDLELLLVGLCVKLLDLILHKR